MSELREALIAAKAMPIIHAKLKKELVGKIGKFNISQLHLLNQLADSKELEFSELYETLLKIQKKSIRVAEWTLRDNRCEHKRYKIGDTRRARIGNIGDAPTWIEAWIA